MNRLTPLRWSGKTETVIRVLVLVAIGVLLATSPLQDWPVNVTVSADSDTTVVVTWYSQEEKGGGFCESLPPDPYDSFELFFQPVGESSWTSVGRTRDTFMAHDPQHRVGKYSVRGWRRDEVNWHPGMYDDATTVPRYFGPVRLHEVSSGDTSALALGFHYLPDQRSHGYVMDTTTTDNGPDVYVTDYRPGSPGPLSIMSVSLVLWDTGAHVSSLNDGWHTTWLSSALPDEQSLPPHWEPFTPWGLVCSLPSAPFVVACRTFTGNYALIKVLSLDSTSVELEAWYQQVRGLRLTGH
jgi:hypothetical protein